MDADSLRQSKKEKKCKAVRVERIWSLKILVLQMSFFQFYMPRSVLNSPKSNFPSPFGSAASIISCVQEDSSEEVVSKCMSLVPFLFPGHLALCTGGPQLTWFSLLRLLTYLRASGGFLR